MNASISAQNIQDWLRECAKTYLQNKHELTALDAAIGDGDHGENMARAFSSVPAKLDALTMRDIESLLRAAAVTLICQSGGASGPLYGTFFLMAARLAHGKEELSLSDLCACFDAGLAGVVHLGKANVGDKTMVDALTPALAALHAGEGDPIGPALERAIAVAREAAEATIPLVARKGRASYLGERSAGHKDPGAASSVLLLEALAKSLEAAASA
jgi:dihydroxyacetone kinase-like protein